MLFMFDGANFMLNMLSVQTTSATAKTESLTHAKKLTPITVLDSVLEGTTHDGWNAQKIQYQ